ncbi:MAG: polysaccharide deacetylase family protein [Halioglobus sp.]|nr:polysaccharide deacetylase family protein [Halioglobus sp.]
MLSGLPVSLATGLLPLLCNPGGEARLSTLIYHRVVPERDPMRPGEPTAAEFDWQMRLLREHFHPLSLEEAAGRLADRTLPRRAVCVTFDDGYADNEQIALPVLKRYAIPATVFVSTGYLNGGRMWNDAVIESLRNWDTEHAALDDLGLARYSLGSLDARREAAEDVLRQIKHRDPVERQGIVDAIAARSSGLPGSLMMTDAQVRNLAESGVSIGAHTVTHPILASVSPEIAREEIQHSKTYLEALLQRDVAAFAYPNGLPQRDYGAEHRAMVEESGFSVAVSTHWGVGVPGSDRLQLPRFTPWDREPLRFAVRLLLNQRKIDPLLA